MRSLLVAFLCTAVSVNAQQTIGAACTHHLQCGRFAFCEERMCRKDGCTISSQCQEGELCQYGSVNGKMRTACFPASVDTEQKEEYCPGGGAVVVGFDGKLSTCDLLKSCSNGHVCNPQFGICCTKLRTCPRPAKSMLNAITGAPIMCQIKFGREMPCPGKGYCETKTGFCCQKDDEPKSVKPIEEIVPVVESGKPWRGQVCAAAIGCDGGAACICANKGNCRCECPTEFGYTVAADGRTCQRTRRRLREKCKTDMECSAAFSECATGGCRCKKGFQRDGDGGCKPINYQCVGNGQPLKQSDKLVTCHLRGTMVKMTFRSLKGSNRTTEEKEISEASNSTLFDWASNDRDSCPEDHYCVPVFDDATRPGYYQGFCCAAPTDVRPTCPVGDSHESSFAPDYGCRECPSDYFCHRDGIATEKSICCPKPCVSLEDIYHDGQCYPMAFYGDSCHISAQCVSSKSPSMDENSEVSRMECSRGVCACPAGFNNAGGECKRVMCSIGLRGEPSVDRNNVLLRCDRSSDCSQGHMCDPTNHVCCKGTNRCPKSYVETGELCTEGGICRGAGQMCYWPKSGKVKVCCTEDDVCCTEDDVSEY